MLVQLNGYSSNNMYIFAVLSAGYRSVFTERKVRTAKGDTPVNSRRRCI